MSALSPPHDVSTVVGFALAEDIGSGDISAQLIPQAKQVSARLISRDVGILCGQPWVEEIFRQLDNSVAISWQAAEGAAITEHQSVANFTGAARSILTAERTALNFLQTLSATASVSQYYSSLVAHTSVRLLDTRKTLPGLRTAQKYAVRLGGCFNHRMGLYDAYLIKENHISACGSIESAVAAARTLDLEKSIEIEVHCRR